MKTLFFFLILGSLLQLSFRWSKKPDFVGAYGDGKRYIILEKKHKVEKVHRGDYQWTTKWQGSWKSIGDTAIITLEYVTHYETGKPVKTKMTEKCIEKYVLKNNCLEDIKNSENNYCLKIK